MKENNYKVLWLTHTYGRHHCLERVVRSFLDQDYTGEHTMIIFDAGHYQNIADIQLPDNKKIIYINETGFASVGEQFNAALKHFKGHYFDIMTHADDDDIFLPNHISEGVKGMIKAKEQGMFAYKPKKSYYRDAKGISLAENTLEPSIFVHVNWITIKKYANVNISYHQRWLDPLLEANKVFIDPEGVPTLIYNWGTEMPVYKISGSGDEGKINFENHKLHSRDFGDYIITPTESNQKYYDEINQVK